MRSLIKDSIKRAEFEGEDEYYDKLWASYKIPLGVGGVPSEVGPSKNYGVLSFDGMTVNRHFHENNAEAALLLRQITVRPQLDSGRQQRGSEYPEILSVPMNTYAMALQTTLFLIGGINTVSHM